jgi:hypothetical protein
MATTAQIDSIVALYAGYFDRAPDPIGLQFWIDQIENGREFNTIAADFAASPEAEALYPYLTTPGLVSPSAFVTSIYLNLFNRSPDAAGLEFWTDALDAGTVSAADMIEAVINGARDDATATPPSFDKATLDNKVEAGLDWAQETSATVGFTYDADAAAAAVAALSGVTDDVATVAAAKAATDVFVSGAEKVGSTFTLTTGVYAIVGTGGQDTFQALVSNNAAINTLNIFDSIDGGAGVDTMNLALGGSANNIPPLLDIDGVEIINMLRNAGNGTVDASVFGAAAEQLWQVGNAGDINNLVEGQTVGFRNTSVSAGDEIDYVAGAVTASVALDNVGTGSTLNIDGDDIETVNISGSIDAAAAFLNVDLGNNTSGADAVTALNLSLGGNTTLNVFGANGEELETIDASGSTGGITYLLPNPGGADTFALETITGGSGNDALTLTDLGDLASDTIAVSGGAGNDVLTIANTQNGATAIAVTVNGGDGADTLELNNLQNVVDASEANFMDSLITFADFNGDEDVLDLVSTTFNTLSNADRANIEAEDNLFDAITLAATLTSGIVAFDFGDNAYVYENNNTAAFDFSDGLVELVGFSVENFDSSNLI